jgi:hypothetical protein
MGCHLKPNGNTTAVHFAGCYFPHGYVEAVPFTEHFVGCYFPRRFTICVFISLNNTEILFHMPPFHKGGPDILCFAVFIISKY